MKPASFALLVLALALSACDRKKSGNETVRREGQPDFIRVPDNDTEMDQAMQTARDSVDKFIGALQAPKAGQDSFTVKKLFKDGEDGEHIWLSGVSFDGTNFKGRIDNEPVNVKNIKMGQMATVAKNEISDWFYIENGKLIGGYTIRLLHSRSSPAEKREFEANTGFKIE
jgi:uncharacterized protein YegJ (DUF2314 family)